jgi:hypothetical protein
MAFDNSYSDPLHVHGKLKLNGFVLIKSLEKVVEDGLLCAKRIPLHHILHPKEDSTVWRVASHTIEG